MRTIALERLDLRPGLRVLDLGCGRGRHLHALYYDYELDVVGLDLSMEDMSEARRWFDGVGDARPEGRSYGLTVGDALHLPFKDNAFDRIVCSEVLEHIPDYATAFEEIRRVLKPDGLLAVSVPSAWPERLCWRLSDAYHSAPGGHIRIFTRAELVEAAARRGFRETGRARVHGLHSPYWWLQCALWDAKERHPAVAAYRRFLEWDIMKRPLLTRLMAAIADPVIGKSSVHYFDRDLDRAEGGPS